MKKEESPKTNSSSYRKTKLKAIQAMLATGETLQYRPFAALFKKEGVKVRYEKVWVG